MLLILGKAQKNWPAELTAVAKASVVGKGHSKPFDKVYTLGFDVLDDEITDINNFNKRAQAFALDSVVTANKLADSKTVVINKLELTKVYAAFWINKYNYQNQGYEVIMSGIDASKMGGMRPVDNGALNAKRPSIKTALYLFLSGIALFIVAIVETDKWPKNITMPLSTISFLIFMLVAPAAFIVTMIKAARWTDPAIKLKKEREQKLAQRLTQRA